MYNIGHPLLKAERVVHIGLMTERVWQSYHNSIKYLVFVKGLRRHLTMQQLLLLFMLLAGEIDIIYILADLLITLKCVLRKHEIAGICTS